jgi:hypothetical protein
LEGDDCSKGSVLEWQCDEIAEDADDVLVGVPKMAHGRFV